MDGLLAEINSKRKALTDDGAGPSKKYVRRGEVEAAREEEERKRRAGEEAARTESRASQMRHEVRPQILFRGPYADSWADAARTAALARMAASPTPARGTPEPVTSAAATTEAETKETFNISAEDCIRRLRAHGQPIRLFGETDKDRRQRLKKFELLDERDKSQTDFKKAMDVMKVQMTEKDVEKRARAAQALKAAEDAAGGANEPEGKNKNFVDLPLIDLSLVKKDMNKLHPQIYWAFKALLREWGEWLDDRPDDVKNTATGRNAAAAQIQSGQNMKPLFKQLRNRDLPPDIVRNLAEVIHYMQQRQYQKANDAYLRMSIGNAAWPIGVTSVGIHERSAEQKIYQDKVGHVLNDETTRRWIQGVKRLVTFNQTVRPPKDNAHFFG